MAANSFDDIARSLNGQASRRNIARALAGLALGGLLVPRFRLDDAAAKKRHKKKKHNKKKKRPACTRSCAGKACGPDGCGGSCGPCDGNESCQSGICTTLSPTCTDGIKNGSESDVDCGGSCPGCTEGQTCASRNDCAGALCHTVLHTCQTCTPETFDCGSDADGSCVCDTTVQGQKVCNKQNVGNPAGACNACAAGTNCVDTGGGSLFCFKPCGAP
jgi:hypothetical protein